MQKFKSIGTRWILLILWMGFIFYMSNMPGEVSTEQSDIIVEMIKGIGINVNGNIGETVSFLVRKIAHITEYAILFILIYRVAQLYISKPKIISLIILFLYAASDEFHQTFIFGREGCIRDVFIDMIGGLISIIIINIIEIYKNRRKSDTKDS